MAYPPWQSVARVPRANRPEFAPRQNRMWHTPQSSCNRRPTIATYQTPEAAYWAFFERFNAQDPDGWAGVMSYPHVRVSAGAAANRQSRFFNPRTAARVYTDHDDYASTAQSMGWDRFIATGWVRTQGMEPVRVHESEDMVLLSGGWTRLRSDDSPIVSNRVLYTLTRLDGRWGIQARFGVDSFNPDSDQNGLSHSAIGSASQRRTARRTEDLDGWLGCFHFPLTAVLGPGRVVVAGDRNQLRARDQIWNRETGSDQAQIRVVAAGSTGVLLSQHPDNGVRRQAELLALRDGSWKTLAITALP